MDDTSRFSSFNLKDLVCSLSWRDWNGRATRFLKPPIRHLSP
jgi:hypothetical protein